MWRLALLRSPSRSGEEAADALALCAAAAAAAAAALAAAAAAAEAEAAYSSYASVEARERECISRTVALAPQGGREAWRSSRSRGEPRPPDRRLSTCCASAMGVA